MSTPDPIAKAEALRERAASSKRDAFAALAEPDRTFLRSVAETFGKPDAICIRFADGSRYDGGTFRNAKDYDDFPQRADVLHQKFVRGES